MNITIVGGGNIGTQFAVHCSEKGHKVTVYTSHPELYVGKLEIVDEKETVTHSGEIEFATDDPRIAFPNAELIFVTVPANVMRDISEVIYNNTDSRTLIGVVPGNGGSECAFRKCVERGNVFFGIERVPAIARLIRKGKCVKSTGYRNELHVSSLPRTEAIRCASIVEDIFEIKTTILPCFLNLTLTPSNPILHTARLRTLFGYWKSGMVYKEIPLFYEDWDDESSRLLLSCDEEVQRICRALPDFDLSFVKSLREHYESTTVEEMTKKISSIMSFKGLRTPSIQVEGGYIPDLNSRYFTADFSYGLTIIKQIARFAGVAVPNIDATMRWYENIAIEKNEFNFSDYNINDLKALKDYYLL